MSSILMVIPSRLEGDSDDDNADDADLDGFFPPRLAFGLTRPPRMVGSCWFPVERRPTTLRRFFVVFHCILRAVGAQWRENQLL